MRKNASLYCALPPVVHGGSTLGAAPYAVDATPRAVILEEKDVFIKTLIQTPKGK